MNIFSEERAILRLFYIAYRYQEAVVKKFDRPSKFGFMLQILLRDVRNKTERGLSNKYPCICSSLAAC